MSIPTPEDDAPEFQTVAALRQHYAGVRGRFYPPARMRAAVARPAASPAVAPAAPPERVAAEKPAQPGAPLNGRLLFATFQTGDENRLACAAALSLATRSAAASFNPLYLYAAPGQGKTHLLQAVAQRAGKEGRRAIYLTAEGFTYDCLAHARRGGAALDGLREATQAADLLLFDDVHLLTALAARREFAMLFAALADSGRQVAVAADRPPGELDMFDERLRSRMAGGLVAEIASADLALRRDILAARLIEDVGSFPGAVPPDDDVLEHVARHVSRSPREMEGALSRLLAWSALGREAPTLEMAEKMLGDLAGAPEPKRVRVDDILRVVAKHYGVTRADILSQRRTANVVLPRQVAMYLAKTITLRSLPEIGRRFGGRDHTTVLHAVRKIEGLRRDDPSLAADVARLIEMAGGAQ